MDTRGRIFTTNLKDFCTPDKGVLSGTFICDPAYFQQQVVMTARWGVVKKGQRKKSVLRRTHFLRRARAHAREGGENHTRPLAVASQTQARKAGRSCSVCARAPHGFEGPAFTGRTREHTRTYVVVRGVLDERQLLRHHGAASL